LKSASHIKVFLRILFSGTLHQVPHRTSTSYSRTEFVLYKMSTSGRISPATFIGCDGSRYLTPLQRSACDYAEVSLLLPYVLASPHMPCGFRDCGCSKLDQQFHVWLFTTGM
jgi:hypothetical protein